MVIFLWLHRLPDRVRNLTSLMWWDLIFAALLVLKSLILKVASARVGFRVFSDEGGPGGPTARSPWPRRRRRSAKNINFGAILWSFWSIQKQSNFSTIESYIIWLLYTFEFWTYLFLYLSIYSVFSMDDNPYIISFEAVYRINYRSKCSF